MTSSLRALDGYYREAANRRLVEAAADLFDATAQVMPRRDVGGS